MSRVILTLRAIETSTPPVVGELMASATGKTTYRIVAVTRLRLAGSPGRDRYRLSIERTQALAGAVVHPWRLQKPDHARASLQRPVQAPMPLASPTCRRKASRAAAPQRVQKAMAVERHTGSDFGPAIRRRAIRSHKGEELREPDVLVDEAVDPIHPSRRMRRAYRVDPVDQMRRAGSIGAREVDAAAELRRNLERSIPSMAGAEGRVGMAPFAVSPVTDEQIRANRKLREACEALGKKFWPPVLWLALGGTVSGYAAQVRMRKHRASELVAAGMTRLADHFFGRAA
jgi:hypothetical protein